jgi:predicted CopG family antitoxin
MTRKLTITIDDEVYEGLYRRIGARKISRFLESLARPHVLDEYLEDEYRAMAADEVRERQALEWADELIGDADDEPR